MLGTLVVPTLTQIRMVKTNLYAEKYHSPLVPSTQELLTHQPKRRACIANEALNMALTSYVCRNIELHRVMSFYKKV